MSNIAELDLLVSPHFNTRPLPACLGASSKKYAPTEKLIYCFTDGVIRESSDSIESDILDSIRRNNAGLELNKTIGLYPTEFFTYEEFPIYRLKSEKNHAYFDFCLWPEEDGYFCLTLILVVQPEYQGSFFNVRDFLINRVAKTLFDTRHRIFYLWGIAIENRHRIRGREWRNKRTKDGKNSKLVRLYQRLGFIQEYEGSENVILLSDKTRQEYANSESPTKRRYASEQGNMVRASLKQTVKMTLQ